MIPDTILEADLNGANEVPPGDPDGSGEATVWIDGDTYRLCVMLSVDDIAQAKAAHIHQGVAGVNGPVVHNLPVPPGTGFAFRCGNVDHALLADIAANPANYYVNVHNADYPGGAVRGQLANKYA